MTRQPPPPLIPTPDVDLSSFASWCPLDHPDPFVCSLRIQPEDLSTVVPHVSNIEYVRWLDRAAELHADSLGDTRVALLATNRMWFVARHEIDYCAESWGDDELLIATWVRSFKKVKSWRDIVVIRPADETVICRAATLWVLVDLDTRRPCRFDLDMITRFQPLESDVGGAIVHQS